ncbi:MAG TPA: MFS transporter [Syntrophomonas sp.]|mgnify:CR=1 FL=1|jgi:hypothetical protein|nr:MFS transporter [Syntrophomonas sp.]
MFKEMRRKDREIIDAKIMEEILINGQYGVLSTMGDGEYPYGVPVNYVYFDKSIYFHCAEDGYKLENIQRNPRVSFCVVSESEVLPHKFSTKYKSVIAFGIASEITDDAKASILFALVEKYSPDFTDEGQKYIESSQATTRIVKIDIQHMTGKERNY